MKSLLLGILVFGCISSFATTPTIGWESLLGCYRTVEFNGKVISKNQPGNESTEISIVPRSDFLNLDGTDVPAIEADLFVSGNNDGSATSYNTHFAFLKHGNFSDDGNVYEFNFTGKLKSRYHDGIQEINQHIRIKRKSTGNLNFLNILKRNGTKTRNEYLLKPVECKYRYKGKSELYKAVRLGQENIAKLLIKSGADVNPSSVSPLSDAIRWGIFPGLVHDLVKAGANVNYKSKSSDYTPLAHAVKSRNAGIVKLLIDNGANINFTVYDHREGGYLNLLMLETNGKVLRVLLDENERQKVIDLNYMVGDTGKTALYFHRDFDGIKALLDSGVNPNLNQTYDKTTALVYHIQRTSGDFGGLDLLVEKTDPTIVDKDGTTALHQYMFETYSTFTPLFKKIKLFIDNGSSINATDNYGNTPLLYSLQWIGKYEVASLPMFVEALKTLIHLGADLNAQKFNNGDTALIRSIGRYKFDSPLEIVKILVDAKAKLHIKNKEGLTALQKAISLNRDDIIKLLREAGALR